MTLKNKLFEALEKVVTLAQYIDSMTQNQETIILTNHKDEMFMEIAKNKEKLVKELAETEEEFESVYVNVKDHIKDPEDIKKLQGLVAKIMELEESISKGEEKNRQLWDSKVESTKKVTQIRRPVSYVAKQYEKNKRT